MQKPQVSSLHQSSGIHNSTFAIYISEAYDEGSTAFYESFCEIIILPPTINTVKY